MNKKLLFLTKNSFMKKLKSKWFIVINILLCILIVCLANLSSIISYFGGDFTNKLDILVMDETHEVGPLLKKSLEEGAKETNTNISVALTKDNTPQENVKKHLGDKVLVIVSNSTDQLLTAKVISNEALNIDRYQFITNILSNIKYSYGLQKANISAKELEKITSPIIIDKVVLSKSKNSDKSQVELMIGTLLPTLILPFFMLIVFLVQMIGSEIYEEKSTKSMEIIISNVSPKTHFLSKIIAANTFVIIQGILLLLYSLLALILRHSISGNSISIMNKISTIITSLSSVQSTSSLILVIIFTIVLLLLSFIAYSFTAAILASMTTNMEDYQQIQTPIMLCLVIAYYLSIMASVFDGSTFIKILSYVPFISCLLSPTLFLLGQINVIDVLISISLLILFNYIMISKGGRVYKEGILNYSNEKVFTKFKKIVKRGLKS